ncbi:MAG: FG-GAP-like repeat-containing protein [Candidatus Contendobacter sp.]
MKLITFNLATAITTLLLLPPLSSLAAAGESEDSATSEARPVSLLQVGESMAPARQVILRHDPSYISTLRVPPPPELALQQQGLMAVQATISINYLPAGAVGDDNCITWPDQPKAAFTYAANLWASQLQSPVPITIDACWANNLPAGVLGHGGPISIFRNFSGAPVSNTWYPVPAANALHGSDLHPERSDIYGAYSSTFNWYFGTDGNTPPSQVDFVSVVLHEITHGLGFLGSMQVSGSQGSWGRDGSPYIYDRFTENGSGQKLLDTALFPNPSAVLASQLQSNDIYFNGANANTGNGGARVPLYAPATWQSGSSYSHLAESYNNTPNALMTFALPNGESIHSPGPVTLGLLKDTGWTLQSAGADTLLLAGLTANGQIYYTANLSTWTQIPGGLAQLQVGDFNGDAKADLAGLASNGSIWYTANLSTWTQVPGGLAQLRVGDLNGDGHADLAGLAGNGSIWYTTNLSSWTQVPGGLAQLQVGDFNGDGKADLAGLAGNGSIWYTTNLSSWTQVPGGLAQLRVGDLNGDGHADLAGLAGNSSIWYTTNLSAWTQVPGGLARLRVGDLNGDGKADLAGLAGGGSIWYTTNLSAWTQIPGQLNRLAGDD